MDLLTKLSNIVKQAVMLGAETFADLELTALISSCLSLITSTGVKEEDLSQPEVESLVLIYVKTFYGFNSDGTVKELPQSFYLLLKQFSLKRGQ